MFVGNVSQCSDRMSVIIIRKMVHLTSVSNASILLWSQIIYGHLTASISPAAERTVRFLVNFLDIVRFPVNFRFNLKYHGAHTAFCRVIECKMTSAGNRTVPGRRLVGVGMHWTGTRRFCFKVKSCDINGDRPGTLRCPAGHCTMSQKHPLL